MCCLQGQVDLPHIQPWSPVLQNLCSDQQDHFELKNIFISTTVLWLLPHLELLWIKLLFRELNPLLFGFMELCITLWVLSYLLMVRSHPMLNFISMMLRRQQENT